MNERIKELAGQALDQAVPQTWTTLTAYDLNKFTEVFAELIIEDCIDNVKVWEKDSRNHISYMLKRQYGVEE